MQMSVNEFPPDLSEESKFTEVLTSEMNGNLLGYRIGGSRHGPNAVLASDAVLTEALFERFMSLPTLPWLWGRLYLVSLDSVDSGCLQELHSCLHGVPIDRLLMLPYAAKGIGHANSIESGYWTGLRLCRQLGMIEGRGVYSGSGSSVGLRN